LGKRPAIRKQMINIRMAEMILIESIYMKFRGI